MKKILLLIVLISSHAFSQSVNDYQYVIVPTKFAFFNENNKYNLNLSVKLLLEKYGFKSFFPTDSVPSEIANSNCKKLYADLEKDNSFMSTKIKIVLKDCREKLIYETAYGKSNEKEYAIAYNQALREAAKSFEKWNYKYNGKNDVQVEEVKATGKVILTENSTPIKQNNGIEIGENNLVSSNSLVAETIENGFLLIDSKNSTIVLKLFKTSNEFVFIATSKTINGVVIKKGKESFFEYYKDGKLVSEALNLKF